MTTDAKPPPERGCSLRNLARAVGFRLAAAGAIALLAFLALGNVGVRFRAWFAAEPAPPRPQATAEAGPGWPHRRGPSYDAVSAGAALADSWPPQGPPVLWVREIGRGYSGFSVVGDRVFTQAQTLTDQYVVCLHAGSGTTLWQHRYGWPYEPGGMYPGPRATPTWQEGRVYFVGPDGRVGCLRAEDGKSVWEVNVIERFDGRGTGFGYAASPLVEQGKVILPVGGEGAAVVALDARDGSTVWASGDQPASYASALPFTFDGRRCVMALLQNALLLVDLRSGRPLGEMVQSRGYDEHAAAPLYDEPLLMIARPFRGGAVCYRLEAGPPAAEAGAPPPLVMETAWQSRELSNDTASSVLVDGHVFGFDLRDVQAKAHRPSRGEFKCLALADGKVRWQTDRVGHATVLAADGKLILFNDQGELILARATPDRYDELGRVAIFGGEICWTAPALDRGRLYLRSPTRAACVFLGRPEQLSTRQRRAARPAAEILQPERFDLTRLVGGEREYAFDPADAEELRRWFAYSLAGVLGVAAVLAAAARWLVSIRRPAWASRVGRAVFWTAAFLLGAAGTPLLNRLSDAFVLTWPVCLFVAHQVTLNTIVWANRASASRRAPWIAMLATCFFVAVCLAYFLVCRRLSLPTEWVFLLGFLPSWPVAVPAAYRFQAGDRPIGDLVWAAAAFAALFWTAGGVLIWQAAAG